MAEKIDRLLEKEADLVEKLKTLRKEKSRIASEKKKALKKEENRENFVVGKLIRKVVEVHEDKKNPFHNQTNTLFGNLFKARELLSESEKQFLAQSPLWKFAFLIPDDTDKNAP